MGIIVHIDSTSNILWSNRYYGNYSNDLNPYTLILNDDNTINVFGTNDYSFSDYYLLQYIN
jgi:hypothetical protein